MARRKLASGAESDNASAYETAAFRPGANSLLLLFVASARPQLPGGAPQAPVVTGNGLLWVQEQTVLYGAGGDRRLTLFRASGAAPAAGSVTIDFGEEQQDFCTWTILEYDDVDVSAPDGKSALAQSFTATATGQSLTRSLSASADPSRNIAVGAIAVESASGATVTVTPGAGFAEIDEEDLAGLFVRAGSLQTQDATASNSVISWTWGSPQSAAAIILEVKAIPPPSGGGDGTGSEPGSSGTPTEDQALVERFQPVMFFAPGEKFFPSDAKRFLEHAALWTAQPVEDDKAGWGGSPGAPFPRKPTVVANGLSGDADEHPGDFRFGIQLGAGNDHRFLELGGWKDSSENPETVVTAASLNRYSNRTAIESLYDGRLEASRFWYHAEVVHETELQTIASRAPGIDLSSIIGRLHTPTLVCYYFFFPAHDQTVKSADCQGLEAREVSSRAGDWQCFAILGEGAGDAFVPKFFGRTGLRPSASPFPPHQFDDDQNTVMIVDSWAASAPTLTAGHPRLFVAAGSHSLYTEPGPHDVDPYPTDRLPQWCGTSDAPVPAPTSGPFSETPQALEDIGVLLAKMIASGPFGFLGATAALVACVAEIAHYRDVTAPFGKAPSSVSHTPPEMPPAAPGAGKTIKPPRLVVPDAGSDVVEWRCAPGQPVQIDNRTYDCMVNRSTQLWWPSFDTKSGFNGRWGQRVTADGFSRRCGPRFPNYPQMFVQALVDGLGRTPPLLTLP